MSTVRFEFVATGSDSVVSAFKSITSAAQQTARTVETSARVTERAARVSTGRGNGGGPYRTAPNVEEAAANRSAKAQERSLAYVARIKDRYFAQQQRQEEQLEKISQRRAQRDQNRAENRREHAISAIRGQVSGAVLGGISTIGSFAASGVGSAARDSMKLQETANRVSINARGAGSQGVSAGTLRHEFENVAIKTPGQSAQDIAEAAQAYVDLTGDLATARANMQSFATVASATGARVQDVATAAASLGKSFDVKDAKDMQAVMATLAFQGKGGAVTMKDLAGQFQKLAAAGNAFDIGKGPQAVATLGGLMQIARTGTKSPQQAGTAVENVFSALTSKSGVLAKEGVHVYDKTGHKRGIEDILTDTISKVGGNDFEKKNGILASVFGKQGSRALNPLVGAYQTAFDGSKKGGGTDMAAQAAGVEALHQAFKNATDVAANWAEVQADAAQAQEDSSAKLTAAWEEIKAKVGDALLPPLGRLADAVTGSSGALDPFIMAIGLAASALASLAEWMKAHGFGPAEKSHGEKAKDAQDKLDSINGKLEARGLSEFSATDKDLKKAGTSREALRALKDTINSEGEASYTKPGEATEHLTEEQFAAKYAALNPNGGETGEDDKLAARTLARDLMADPKGAAANDYTRGTLGDENADQRDLRHNFQAQITSDKAGGLDGATKDAMDALKAAATEAATALKSVKAPNSTEGAIAPQ